MKTQEILEIFPIFWINSRSFQKNSRNFSEKLKYFLKNSRFRQLELVKVAEKRQKKAWVPLSFNCLRPPRFYMLPCDETWPPWHQDIGASGWGRIRPLLHHQKREGVAATSGWRLDRQLQERPWQCSTGSHAVLHQVLLSNTQRAHLKAFAVTTAQVPVDQFLFSITGAKAGFFLPIFAKLKVIYTKEFVNTQWFLAKLKQIQ